MGGLLYTPSFILYVQCVEVRISMISFHQREIIDYNKVGTRKSVIKIYQRKTSQTSGQHCAVNRRAAFVVPEYLEELVFAA